MTICAKEYVDALIEKEKSRIRIESGTATIGDIPNGTGGSKHIKFSTPAKNNNISVQLTITGNAADWGGIRLRVCDLTVQGFDIEYWQSWDAAAENAQIAWLAVFYDN